MNWEHCTEIYVKKKQCQMGYIFCKQTFHPQSRSLRNGVEMV